MFSSKNNKSFTILELLVVLSVLAIMAGLGIPKIKGMRDLGTKLQVKKDLMTLQGALESYYMFGRPNAYPKPYPGADWIRGGYNIQSTALITASPKAIQNILYDPFQSTATEYYYYTSNSVSGGCPVSTRKYWAVFSVGLNGSFSHYAYMDCSGVVQSLDNDDICITNGSGCTNLFVCGTYQCNPSSTSKYCCNGFCSTTSNCTSNGAPCSANAQCSSGICTTYNGTCSSGANGQNCLQSSECTSTYCGTIFDACTSGANGEYCNQPSECSSGHCDGDYNICRSGANGQHCFWGADCVSGHCVDFSCSASGAGTWGSYCADNASCASGHCYLYQNSGNNMYGQCTDGVSWSDPCRFGSECVDGYCLDGGNCEDAPGGDYSWCNDGASCSSGYCIYNQCYPYPGNSGDSCNDGHSCSSGYCIGMQGTNPGYCNDTPGVYNDFCMDNASCASGHCVRGLCAV